MKTGTKNKCVHAIADVNICNQLERTPVDLAQSNSGIIKLLLKKNCD